MARVLVSWVGNTDLQASQGDPKAGLGPLGQAFTKRSFDEIALLSNYKKPQNDAYLRWAKPQTQAKLTLQHVDLPDPTEFLAIFQAVDPLLAALTERFRKSNQKLELTFHLSPGTPSMSTIWMLLAKTRYPAELIQSSREQGVRTTAVPFDIVAEFIELVPRLTAQPDAALAARSGGEQREAERFGDIVYRCQAMTDVVNRARKAAARRVSVLIQGETGTGKELFARAIYQASPRAKRPFVVVNCGAVPRDLVESELFGHVKGSFTGATADRRGAFREAHGGTLFLYPERRARS
jgi:transcriptional regulator with GAF, ATPase, and Fis domain